MSQVSFGKGLRALAVAGTLAWAAPAFAQEAHEGAAAQVHEGIAPEAHEGAPLHKGAGHEGVPHEVDYKSYGIQGLNFAILLFIIGKFGIGALNKMLAARREQLKTDLVEAAQARAAAEERLKLQEKRLGNLEQELSTLRSRLKHEADDEKARLVAAAEERVKRIQAETQFLLEQQIKEAEQRFRAEVADAAIRIAEAEVRRALQPADEQRLVQSFVGELERGSAAAGSAS